MFILMLLSAFVVSSSLFICLRLCWCVTTCYLCYKYLSSFGRRRFSGFLSVYSFESNWAASSLEDLINEFKYVKARFSRLQTRLLFLVCECVTSVCSVITCFLINNNNCFLWKRSSFPLC